MRPWFFGVLLVGCQGATPGAPAGSERRGPFVIRGALDVEGRSVELGVSGATFVDAAGLSGARVVDLGGAFVVPAFIDSHVHLTYYPVADQLPAGGVAGAVNFAAPFAALTATFPIVMRQSGPMLTSLLGYPTQSWGQGGYGLEVATPDEARDAVDRVLDAGASFVKTPLVGDAGVDDDELFAIVERAHERGVRVAVHALGATDAERAVQADVNILAHTPEEALPSELFEAFADRAVVSTLSAFGASTEALTNLRAFADHGATVLYGTDLGNTRDAGIQLAEVAALGRAGFSGAEIVHAATDRAADFWGMTELGRLEPGRNASFLVLAGDPNLDPVTLATPVAVVIDGEVLAGSL